MSYIIYLYCIIHHKWNNINHVSYITILTFTHVYTLVWRCRGPLTCWECLLWHAVHELCSIRICIIESIEFIKDRVFPFCLYVMFFMYYSFPAHQPIIYIYCSSFPVHHMTITSYRILWRFDIWIILLFQTHSPFSL